MAHRAKHLRRNWTAERVAASHRGKGPVGTPPTTGLARAIKGLARAHQQLRVVSFLGRS